MIRDGAQCAVHIANTQIQSIARTCKQQNSMSAPHKSLERHPLNTCPVEAAATVGEIPAVWSNPASSADPGHAPTTCRREACFRHAWIWPRHILMVRESAHDNPRIPVVFYDVLRLRMCSMWAFTQRSFAWTSGSGRRTIVVSRSWKTILSVLPP